VAGYNNLLGTGENFAYGASIARVVAKLQAIYRASQAGLDFVSEEREKEIKLASEERKQAALTLLRPARWTSHKLCCVTGHCYRFSLARLFSSPLLFTSQ
jgi:hypothetical protein